MGRGNTDNSLIPGLAQRLKDARRDAGFNQREAAKAIGVDPNTIWRYENNRLNPSNSALLALSYTYGKPIGWFKGTVEEDHPGTRLINEDERRFLDVYRGVPKESRNLVLRIMEAAAGYEVERKVERKEPEPQKPRRGAGSTAPLPKRPSEQP